MAGDVARGGSRVRRGGCRRGFDARRSTLIGLAQQLGFTHAPLAISLGPVWRFFGVFHPAVVHFPIALLILAAAVETWSLVRRKRAALHTTQVCLYFRAAAAVVATRLGWANADANAQHGTIVAIHRWLGVAVAV